MSYQIDLGKPGVTDDERIYQCSCCGVEFSFYASDLNHFPAVGEPRFCVPCRKAINEVRDRATWEARMEMARSYLTRTGGL